jgi:hypothetical protein
VPAPGDPARGRSAGTANFGISGIFAAGALVFFAFIG